jgi:lipopolysaccharide transport system ATP-binding protein
MSSTPVIRVEELGKKYIISHEAREKYTALRDVISRKAKKILKGNMVQKSSKEDFWALKDVSFEVTKGEAIGIIGPNGAGKSTLLKLLSRITEPTNGVIEIDGSVATLLEVGTGFHPELTGLENIYLNGAILGMKRPEIRKKFDEIVDFSGVEKFLDTPVKRYSNGMYMRLAFAVAAHLEPDILIIDEVLAVGDAEFQEKCLGKMNEVTKKDGRTVLFVSHNLSAVQQLCQRSIWLQNGRLCQAGQTKNVIEQYLHAKEGVGKIIPHNNKDIFISDFCAYADDQGLIVPGAPCTFKMAVSAKATSSRLHFGIGINDRMGNRIVTPFTRYDSEGIALQSGLNEIHCRIESLPLKPGSYDLHLYVGSAFEACDYIAGGIDFLVHPFPFFKYSMPEEGQGPIVIKQKWF